VEEGLRRGHVEHRREEVCGTAEEAPGTGGPGLWLLRLLGLFGAEGRGCARGYLRGLGPARTKRRHQAHERCGCALEAGEPRLQTRRVAVPRGAEIAEHFHWLIFTCKRTQFLPNTQFHALYRKIYKIVSVYFVSPFTKYYSRM
jgi:hypothetical protein